MIFRDVVTKIDQKFPESKYARVYSSLLLWGIAQLPIKGHFS